MVKDIPPILSSALMPKTPMITCRFLVQNNPGLTEIGIVVLPHAPRVGEWMQLDGPDTWVITGVCYSLDSKSQTYAAHVLVRPESIDAAL